MEVSVNKVLAFLVMTFAAVNLAAAQTVTFSTDHGAVLREHATNQRHQSFRDEHFRAQVGGAVPAQVELHDLPSALHQHVPQGHQYRYGIVNERPVIVDHSNRRIIHHFD
jgi:hypothetical protein